MTGDQVDNTKSLLCQIPVVVNQWHLPGRVGFKIFISFPVHSSAESYILFAKLVHVFIGAACSNFLLYLTSFFSAFPEQLFVHSV